LDKRLRPSNTCDVLLLDGLNLIFRAHYSLGKVGLHSGGIDTAVLYSSIRTLLSLAKEFYPRNIIVCWDGRKGKYRRKDIYPAYKEGRSSLDADVLDSLFNQVDLYKEFLGYLNIGSVTLDTFEADDVLVALSQWFEAEDLTAHIVTSDKDLQQAITDKVSWYDPIQQVFLTKQKFELEFGYSPQAVVDYKVMVGDSSDNITGVAGIGKKTASTILQEYGTLDNFLNTGVLTGRKEVFTLPNTKAHMKLIRSIIDIPAMQPEHFPETCFFEWEKGLTEVQEPEIYGFLRRYNMKSLTKLEAYKDFIATIRTLEPNEVLNECS